MTAKANPIKIARMSKISAPASGAAKWADRQARVKIPSRGAPRERPGSHRQREPVAATSQAAARLGFVGNDDQCQETKERENGRSVYRR